MRLLLAKSMKVSLYIGVLSCNGVKGEASLSEGSHDLVFSATDEMSEAPSDSASSLSERPKSFPSLSSGPLLHHNKIVTKFTLKQM